MPLNPSPGPGGGSGPGIPEPPKKTREINWTAVGSLAAVAAALIAFLAYALPGGLTPDPATTPQSTSGSPSTALPTEATSAPATTSPPSHSPVPSLTQASGPPAGCQQADAAITIFDKLNGETKQSKVAAASQAGQQIGAAYHTALSSGFSSAVSSDLYALYQDFGDLQNTALFDDGSGYNTALAQTNKDIQTLNTDCITG